MGAGDQGGGEQDAREEDSPSDDGALEDALDLDDDAADAPEEELDFGPPRGAGELCADDRQCGSGLCFLLEAGADQGFCTDFCFSEQDCALEGFDCVRLVNGGSDGVQICAPVDFCLDLDGDGYGIGPGCEGPDCDDEDPGSNPGAAELCDGVDNDCDGEVDDRPVDVERSCQTGLVGACAAGTTACVEGALVCAPLIPPTDEFCDGLDNDCDGDIDEGEDGEALRQSCYGGPEGSEGVGACAAGARVCVDGQISDCEGQVLPSFEVCDGVDNDCDGEADEGSPGAGARCETALEGACRFGLTACVEGALVCAPRQAQAQEVCDGLDNDCDGEVDEGEEGEALTRRCYDGAEGTEGVGACVAGLQRCQEGDFGACEGQVLPTAEVCDGSDNDCDGEADEGNPAGGFVCATGLPGVCARGATSCTDEGTRCEPFFAPSAEVCDGLDNDCDGEVDEGEEGEALTRRCYDGAEGTEGVGACVAGLQRCQEGDFGACEGQVPPAPESCDGLDNDCDGEEDEDNPEAGVRCQTGAQGVCALGVTSCAQGALVCEALAQPSAEVCDGLDNDCDGDTDEDSGGQPLARSCYDGAEGSAGVGVCAVGRSSCVGGQFGACEGQVLPSPESCDGLDNDCDGEEDEDNPEAGVRCQTGAQGVCALGVTSCAQGALVCEALAQPSAEVCDGLDNDCDGDTDEDGGGQPLSQRCYDGDRALLGRGACVEGVERCVEGSFGACEGQVLPSPESCDGLDNDCDGQEDEDAPGAGLGCATGGEGVCAVGVTACAQGALVCVQSQSASDEVCDGLDNDCDGQRDDGFSGLGEPCFSGLGICRRAGVNVCDGRDPRAQPVCDAQPGQPRPQELCDFNDDDCDGQVDEDFRNESGVYDQVTDCGSCGLSCEARWPGGSARYNVSPLCVAMGQLAACDFVCVGAYVDADRIPENGCEFLPDSGAIYVSSPANGGSDVGQCGAWDSPCATIARGLDRAVSASRARVRVSDGLYRENVRMRNGVSLLGGHNARSWVRDPAVFVTVLNGFTATPQSADRVAVDASGITAQTELSGFTINAEDAAPGGNSVAVYALNPGGGLVIQQNILFAGSGGNGTTGARGAIGANGANGVAGVNSLIRSVCNFTQAASAGGARTCANPNGSGSTNVSGGAGGSSTCPIGPSNNGQTVVQNSSGAAGQGPSAGSGGAGAFHFGTDNLNRCIVGNNAPITASPGLNGGAGADGAGGAGAVGGNRFVGGQWRGNEGGAAAHGGHGGGGGGGGSAAGVDASARNPSQRYYGATGGGGGSGGCAGVRGGGGGAGGASFGVLIVFDGSGPTNVSQVPRVTNNTLRRGQGGQGGAGGAGGSGGDPGLGAVGGNGLPDGTFGGCMFEGAVGAAGGRGGHGGGGGGGQGGASYDVYIRNSNGLDSGFSNNIFSLSAQTNTAGAGGPGGTSNNTSVGIGRDGAAGPFGTLMNEP